MTTTIEATGIVRSYGAFRALDGLLHGLDVCRALGCRCGFRFLLLVEDHAGLAGEALHDVVDGERTAARRVVDWFSSRRWRFLLAASRGGRSAHRHREAHVLPISWARRQGSA